MTITLDPKRVFDVIVSSVSIVVLAPVIAAVALAVRASSAGPVIFRQERVGRYGRIFRIHKFRTMRIGHAGPLITTSIDDRVTRIGSFLRRTKLDEIPQLFDVVRGDMSMVGPRPEVGRYVALWAPEAQAVILSVRPGITDPATVQLRHESDELATAEDPERHYVTNLLPRKVEAYLQYVTNRTLVLDLRILFDTLRAVLVGMGHRRRMVTKQAE